MQKMVTMPKEKCQSLYFYKYLCQKIGTKEDVKIRRLSLTTLGSRGIEHYLVSGSKGEGLSFESSDLDIMFIDSSFRVYESEKDLALDCQTIPLFINTEETQPCFTQLCLHNLSYHDLPRTYQNMFQKNHLGYMLSSEQYKRHKLSIISNCFKTPLVEIHGPCVSDVYGHTDFVHCLRSDKWIVHAQPWMRRSRTTWPPPEIISKIITWGMLFVPIGCKGSANENLEWRISFSVAEKFLIFSFSHTQLLCYALLKILLKEIIEKHGDLKDLLCSYFLKTLMFWISEETDINSWRADNIIPCFMSCLLRLKYCVKYSVLLHYFIPDNNLFFTRFNVMKREKLTTLLENLCDQGMSCFAWSETLKDYHILPFNNHESLSNGKFRIVLEDTLSYAPCYEHMCFLYYVLHHSSSGLSRGLLALQFSKACMYVQDASNCCYSSENKQQYLKFKYDLSHLMIGVHSDAVSGWLRLASFFYVNTLYLPSLAITKYALQKYTDEKIYAITTYHTFNHKLNCFQKHVLNLMKKEKLYKAYTILHIHPLVFTLMSTLIPQELQLDVTNHSHCCMYNPQAFGHFLSFLCNYHLHDIASCRYYLQHLTTSIFNAVANRYSKGDFPILRLIMFSAIGHQLLGETNIAKNLFQLVANLDYLNLTSASSRSKLLDYI